MLIQNSRVPQLQANVFGAQGDRPVQAAPTHWLRGDWLAACTLRLIQLRPDQGTAAMAATARDLWPDVAAFDPVIAAEMEYETWLAGEPFGGPAPVATFP